MEAIRFDSSQIALNESPDCRDIVIDDRGGVGSRLGLERANSSALVGASKQGFYWESGGLFIVQVGAQLYKSSSVSSPSFVTMGATHLFTTSAQVGMCDFNGTLVIVHPVDGVFTSDGTTATSRSTTVKGSAIAVWQNKCWVASDTTARVWWSNINDATVWTTASDFNDIFEVDNLPCTAIGVGAGMDIAGRPGLLVFKRRSFYRINDSGSGSYTTMSTVAGAAGPNAVSDIGGLTAFANDLGIWITDGVGEVSLVSEKIEPLFITGQLEPTDVALAGWAAGRHLDRFVFSLQRAGATVNDLTLMYHPGHEWIVPHAFGANWFQYVPGSSMTPLWSGHPVNAYVYKTYTGGDDDGTAISAHWKTKFIEANSDAEWQFVRARIKGRAVFGAGLLMRVYPDWNLEGDDHSLIDLEEPENNTGVWDQGNWDIDLFGTGFWDSGASISEFLADVHNLGRGNAMQLRFSASTTGSANKPALLDFGAGPEVGAWNIYGARLDYIPLGAT
jgi:hypothetical protein